MTSSTDPLRRFFAFVERHGPGTLLFDRLVEELGGGPRAEDVVTALTRAKIVREAGRAEALPCPELLDCAREIREVPAPAGGRASLRLVAVCGAESPRCETRELSRDELREVTISGAEICRSVRALLKLDDAPRLPARLEGPIELGVQSVDGIGARDVFLVIDPRPKTFDALLERLERSARPSLVLVPSGRSLGAARRSPRGPGNHVEIDALADLSALRDGVLVLAQRVRLVRAELPADAAPRPAKAKAKAAKAPSVTLVVDAERLPGRMSFLVNDQRVSLQDAHFGMLMRLIDARLREPDGWTSGHHLGIPKRKGAVSKTHTELASVLPEGFVFILNDRRGQYQLNPAIVIARVDWGRVAAHPDETLRKIAKQRMKG